MELSMFVEYVTNNLDGLMDCARYGNRCCHCCDAGMLPNATARATASESLWESPEAHALFCDLKRSTGDKGNFFSLRIC
jgi:hypothetical protein